MRDMYPRISTAIYRNLEEFEEIGLVEITQRSNCKAVKFLVRTGPTSTTTTLSVKSAAGSKRFRCLSGATNFYEQQLPGVQITGHSFELYGLCAQCAKEAGSK